MSKKNGSTLESSDAQQRLTVPTVQAFASPPRSPIIPWIAREEDGPVQKSEDQILHESIYGSQPAASSDVMSPLSLTNDLASEGLFLNIAQ